MNHHPHLLQQQQLLPEPPPLQPPPPPPPALQQQQQLPLPPSRFTICKRHPEEPLTGFCASCLRERLAGLDSSISTISHPKTSSSTTTAAATIKSIFRGGSSSSSSVIADNNSNRDPFAASTSSSSNLPELRRCKSFSGRKAEGLSTGFEPKRKSCDVRGGIPTLYNLINREVDTADFEIGEEIRGNTEEIRGNREEIRATQVIQEVEIEAEEEEEEELVTMKDHLEQESQNKKQHSGGKDLKEIAGNFWSAASVFTKKLQKWKKKQKPKKSETSTTSGLSSTATNHHHNNKTHTELADYGRRSCDIDPRFSLDIGRISFDGPRYSLDEPRASWDGYLIGKTFPRLAPMVSVVEDAAPIPVVKRSDNQIPVEETSNFDTTPGGTAQTRDYYSSSDSSQRRRKSFDQSSSDLSQRRRKSFERSTSNRKKAAAVGAELDDSRLNSKVSPTNVEFHGAKLIGTDRDLRDSRANSLRNDDRSESQSHESVLRDSVSCSVDQKESKKSSSRWSKAWNIWGIMNKKNPSSSKDDDDDEEERSSNRANVVERSFSESWQELRKDTNANGEPRSGINRVLRSNSSVSSRNAINNSSGAFGSGGAFNNNVSGSGGGGAFGNVSSGSVRNAVETNGIGKKKKEEVVLERTKSARYSTSDVIDNGLLRFYLTPLRNSKRSASGNGRPKNNAQSIAKRVLGLY